MGQLDDRLFCDRCGYKLRYSDEIGFYCGNCPEETDKCGEQFEAFITGSPEEPTSSTSQDLTPLM
jgi:predicted amidophosphoribosyltransferase